MKVGRRVALTSADICSEDGDGIGDNADLNIGPDLNSIDGAKCSDDVGVKVIYTFANTKKASHHRAWSNSLALQSEESNIHACQPCKRLQRSGLSSSYEHKLPSSSPI
jgi:hypothetical protein